MGHRGATFIGEGVQASFGEHGGFLKRPCCPRSFGWRGTTHTITRCLREWKDYARRGKMAHNMRSSHLEAAEKRGSRGVGRYYFRVLTEEGRIFDLYYDRAPKDTADRGGSWHLLQELPAGSGGESAAAEFRPAGVIRSGNERPEEKARESGRRGYRGRGTGKARGEEA